MNARSTRPSGSSAESPGIVVRGPRARCTPRSPARRISRSTVHRADGWPSRRSCAWTFLTPYTPRLSACTRRISPNATSSLRARADGARDLLA